LATIDLRPESYNRRPRRQGPAISIRLLQRLDVRPGREPTAAAGPVARRQDAQGWPPPPYLICWPVAAGSQGDARDVVLTRASAKDRPKIGTGS